MILYVNYMLIERKKEGRKEGRKEGGREGGRRVGGRGREELEEKNGEGSDW